LVDKLHKNPQRKAEFPALNHLNHKVTSPQSLLYNCFAWAFGDDTRRWDPDPMGQYYWPLGVTRALTVEAVSEVAALNGFVATASQQAVKGREKIALYANNGVPTHLAKQTIKGKWSSKLGDAEDIEHALSAIEGPHYGHVIQVFERPSASK
jgi:hypothetical protein